MTRPKQDDARRYLLGQMSADEADALERGYFEDPAQVDEVAAAESDLVDGYVAGALSAPERAAFESHYLASPVHRDRVDTATRLRVLATPARRRVPAWSIGLAAAAVIAALALALAMLMRPAPDAAPRTAEGPATTTTAAPAATPDAPLAASRPATAPKRSVTLALVAVRVRGAGGTPELRLAPDVDEVTLELGADLGTPSGSWRFTLATVDGTAVASGPVQVRSGRGVARVRASLLRADDYILAVHGDGEGPVAQYFFRVTR